MAAEWSLLPSPLVDSVAGRLDMANQARMSSVCKTWRQAMANGLCRRRPVPSIWLLLPHSREEETHDEYCEFPSFSEGMKRRYFFSMPGGAMPLEKAVVVGSSNGWLMLEDEAVRLNAFNPVTKVRLLFPASDWQYRQGFGAIEKAVFVPPKAGRGGSKSPVVVAILRLRTGRRRSFSELAFAAAGDGVWTDLPGSSRCHFHDIAAHDGKIYALGERSQVMVFDFGGEQPSTSTLKITEIKVEPHFNPHCMKHLGVISGELVLLQWWTCTACPLPRRRCVAEFEVFRLLDGEQNQSEWVKTTDLEGHAILHGNDGIVAIPAGEYRELKRDCVYSVETGENCLEVGLTVTNVANRAVRFEPLPILSSCSLFWFLPHPGT